MAMIDEGCRPIVYEKGSGSPVVVVIGSIHGDEPVGAHIVEELKDTDIKNGTLLGVVGHPCGLRENKRFFDTDLNRSFPGKESGGIEEELAHLITKVIKRADYVLDIHSTTTDLKDVVIITGTSKKVKELVNMLEPASAVLVQEGMRERSLIYTVDGAVSLEYGHHDDKQTYTSTMGAVRRVLSKLGMVDDDVADESPTTEYFEVYGTVDRPKNFKMISGISNLKLVKEGDLLGDVGGEKIYAEEDFYPFLFGPNAYEHMMGFKARKIEEL